MSAAFNSIRATKPGKLRNSSNALFIAEPFSFPVTLPTIVLVFYSIAKQGKESGISSKMALRINPNHPGTVMRYLLIGEAIINSIEGYFFLFAPNKFLYAILAEGTVITPAHETLLRCFGLVFFFGVTFLTAVTALNTATMIESRKTLYLMYAVVEGVAIPFFWYLGQKGPAYSGFDPDSCKFIAKNLVVPFVGRLVALWTPSCFGQYVVVGDSNKKR